MLFRSEADLGVALFQRRGGRVLLTAAGRHLHSGRADGPAFFAAPPAVTDFAPADVMTIRRLIEPQAMPLVVMWATARDFEEMERCVTGGDHAVSYEEFETWDLALHRCIMTAAPAPAAAAAATADRKSVV